MTGDQISAAAAGSLCPRSLPPGEPHALYIHTDVLIHTTYTLIETCQLGSHDEKKGNNENFRPADLGEQDLAKPWNPEEKRAEAGFVSSAASHGRAMD